MCGLSKLPRDVLEAVMGQLATCDLESLSQTSKFLYKATESAMQRSITIHPRSEADIYHLNKPYILETPLHYTTHLRFESGIRHITTRRCPHEREYIESWCRSHAQRAGVERDYLNEEGSNHMDIKDQAKVILRQLRKGQLNSFSWVMGACIPAEILGPQGALSLNQRSLRSLKLVTDHDCRFSSQEDCRIDLSSFYQVQSLSWTGPTINHLEALRDIILKNSQHLRMLRLDFVNLFAFLVNMHSQNPFGQLSFSPFETLVLGLTYPTPLPLFQTLRVLSLSEAPLSSHMAHAINFDTLDSLILRKCRGWDQLLDQIVRLNVPVRLKCLEIQDSEDISDGMGHYTIKSFLDSFSGLENLFIGLPGPISTIEIWRHALGHRDTLKRLVQHQRALDLDRQPPCHHKEVDIPNLGVVSGDISRINGDISANPLIWLDLECIGLACRPELMRPILAPFCHKKSLKFLHIRQSSSDSCGFSSWVLEEISAHHPSGDFDTPDSMSTFQQFDASRHYNSRGANNCGLYRFRNQFTDLVKWMFGKEGIASVQVIAYGDFAFGAGHGRNNFFLCKTMFEGNGYEILTEEDPKFQGILRDYRGVLESCPSESYLPCGST